MLGQAFERVVTVLAPHDACILRKGIHSHGSAPQKTRIAKARRLLRKPVASEEPQRQGVPVASVPWPVSRRETAWAR